MKSFSNVENQKGGKHLFALQCTASRWTMRRKLHAKRSSGAHQVIYFVDIKICL